MNTADLLWQSTLLLGLGALASLAHRRRPARGHHALLLAAAMTLVLPVLALGVGALGWGLLPAPSQVPLVTRSALPIVAQDAAEPTLPFELPTGGGAPVAPSATTPALPSEPTIAAPPDAPAAAPTLSLSSLSSLPWRRIALAAWAALSLLAALRLAISWQQASRLVARSRPTDAPALQGALVRAAERLGLARRPRLAESEAVTSPLLWPWARDGVVLLPAGAAAPRRVDWDAVFTHELAHLRRRDHRGLLVANLLVIALPWQPLAWWCRRQIARLADLACDDWVLVTGHARADYAGALLAFVPTRGRAWAQAAVSNGGTLRERIRRILEHRRTAPLLGRGWSWAAGALALLVALGVACAQPRGTAAAEFADATADEAADQVSGVRVDGVVRDSTGQPRSGVTVRAVSTEHGVQLQHKTTTDHDGRFRFEGLDSKLWWSFSADDPASARHWIGEIQRDLRVDGSTSIELVLQPPERLSGTVRNAEGLPVSGARVTLIREFPDDPMKPLQGDNSHDLAVTTTDAAGRFTLERLRPGWVALMLDHPDYARGFTGMPRPKAGEQDVGLVIERGYTLRGRVTVDGKPLPDVAIHTSTPHAADRAIGEWSVRTDQLGRFELPGVSTKLSRSSSSSGWPLVTLSIDDPHWTSPGYRVFDEGKPELPEVELQAVPRDPAAPEAPSIDVNRPTSGTVARLAGEPSGTATLRVVLDAPARDRDGKLRQVWLSGPAGESTSSPRRESVDDSGIVVYDQLAAGNYSLWVPPTEPPALPTVSVSLGDGEMREVTLHPGPARVHGMVTCGGVPVTRGIIDVNRWQTEPYIGFLQGYGVVNPDGSWEASGLPFGRYRITYDNGKGGHSVPNYFFVDVNQPVTRLDLVLPQTRIDFTLQGRELKPTDFDELAKSGMDIKYFIMAYPGGTAPMGGNTAGIINVEDGAPFVEHLPPGRWTLKTSSTEDRELAARVVLADDTSHVEATLTRVDAGTAVIEGRLLGFEPDKAGPDRWIDVTAYPHDPAGLDVTAAYGKVTIAGDRYRIEGLPAGRYALLVATDAVRPNGRCVAPLFVPDVVVADGAHLQRNLELQPGRLVKLQARIGGEPTYLSTWRVALDTDDWLPFHIFIGSSPRANVTSASEFMLPLGEHQLEVTFRGEAPQVRTIRVEPGDGVQEIVIER